MRLGERIKELREKKGWEQKDLAKKIGMNAGNLSRIEQGKQGTTLKRLEKIAKVLGVSVQELI